jgi:hypothetical protein
MRVLFPFLLLLAAGCALFPVSEQDCKVADWRSRGYQHGLWGHHPQDLRLEPECRERHGVEMNTAEYLAGWRDGHDEWYRVIGSMDRRR